MKDRDTSLTYAPGATKDPETFRSMAKAWGATKNPSESQERRPMNMPIPTTYPMANQRNITENHSFRNNGQEYVPSKSSMARGSKHGYYNSNSNTNSNSNYFSLNHSSAENRYLGAPSRPWGGGAQPFCDVVKEKEEDIFCDVFEKEIPYEPTLEDIMREVVQRLGLRESNMIWVELGTYYRDLGWELCVYAIERAERQEKYQWSYVRGILKRLKSRGIRSRQEAEAYDQKRREEMGLGMRP